MANLYTKTGDKGQTSLYGGERIPKNSVKVECYGIMDEANSMLGLAYSQSKNEKVRTYINKIQKRIFSLGAELASDAKGKEMLTGKISEDDISYLESIVDECTEIVGVQTHFVVPGKNQVSATLHVARTIVRRGERNIVTLSEIEPVRNEVMKYVNRMSDAIYALARVEEFYCEVEELKTKVLERVKQKLKEIEQKSEEVGTSNTPIKITEEPEINSGIDTNKSEKKTDRPVTTGKSVSIDQNQTVELNLQTAKKMVAFAEEKAKEINVPVVISVVDSGGHVMLMERMEDSLLASIDISLNKAYTALSLKMTTEDVQNLCKPGDPLYGIQESNNNRIITFGGGIPFTYKGKVVGALGISGGTVEEDTCVARYAIESVVNLN
ncbi:cob(I)yrinic acid a,c-diamide adenosyltransferase [Intestinibacter sp.]